MFRMKSVHEVLRIFNIIKEDIEDFIRRAKLQDGKLPKNEYETLVLLSKQLQNLKVKLSNITIPTKNKTLKDF